jgi:hypothetical protein
MGLFSKLAGVAGTVIGGAVGGPIGAKIGGALGSSLGGSGGGGGGGATSPQAAGFTPYSITSGLATSKIDPTAQTATYTLSPEMQAFRDRYYAGASTAMPTAESTAYGQQVRDYGQNLFAEAANMDTGAMTQEYFNQQQALLNPAREAESSRLNDLMFSRGTLGQGVGMGGGYVNPQQYALAQAREQQNAALALSAEDRARAIQTAQLAQAGNIYGLGQSYLTDPYATANQIMSYGTGVENLGINTMATGMNFGNTATTSNQNAANINANINQQNYLNNLARSNANAAAWNSGLGQLSNVNWGGLFGGGSSSSGDGQYSGGGSYDPLGRY